ncbi:hypothetical protein C0989_006760, partial [Termitomyces sp. Mn162]
VANEPCKNKLVSEFVADTMFLATTKTLPNCHDILADMMHRASGGFDWSLSHGSPFKLSKLALMNFPCFQLDKIPDDLSLTHINPGGAATTQLVKTVLTYKYLGVVFDTKLQWSAHSQKVVARAA